MTRRGAAPIGSAGCCVVRLRPRLSAVPRSAGCGGGDIELLSACSVCAAESVPAALALIVWLIARRPSDVVVACAGVSLNA
eukprot:1414249-Prymnesium_polylepis.1